MTRPRPEPHPVDPRRPRPIAKPTPPPQPRPSRIPATATLARLAAALILVGALGLTVHYWPTLLLLVALPTKQWRAAAMSPDRPAPALARRDAFPPASARYAAGLSGRSGSSSRNASPGGALAG